MKSCLREFRLPGCAVHAAARRARAHRPRQRAQACLSGTWLKDDAVSEPADATCDLFELNFVVRNALVFVKTLVIEDTPDTFSTRLKALVLNIDERYEKSGKPAQYNRRDLRLGKLTGRYQETPEGYPSITAVWEDPVKGQSVDVFMLSADGRSLTQQTTYQRASNGQTTQYKTVYRLQANDS